MRLEVGACDKKKKNTTNKKPNKKNHPSPNTDTVKIGYIDPLSGGGASIGEVGLKTFQFLADELNAKGGIQGKKVEIVRSTTRPIRRKA